MAELSTQPLLALSQVCVEYARRPVVHDVSLEVNAGEVVCLLGPNGAGKSTLLNVVAGLVAPSAGNVTIAGRNSTEFNRQEHARHVALVAQRSELAHGFRVREVVAMGRAPHQGAWLRGNQTDSRLTEEAITACNLTSLAERPLTELSGGELQRVQLARALCQQTPIMLLDEMAAHLDVKHAVEAYELLREQVAAQKLACIAVMHDLNTAARYADRVALLKDGVLVASGPAAEVMQEQRLAEVFGTAILSDTAADGQPYFVASSHTAQRDAQ